MFVSINNWLIYIWSKWFTLFLMWIGAGLGKYLLSSWAKSSCSEIKRYESSCASAIDCEHSCQSLLVWFYIWYIMAVGQFIGTDVGSLTKHLLMLKSEQLHCWELFCQVLLNLILWGISNQISSSGNFVMLTPVRRSWRSSQEEVGYIILALISINSLWDDCRAICVP